ncbi:hypothetical protein D3C87_1166100 [compost metagenome]
MELPFGEIFLSDAVTGFLLMRALLAISLRALLHDKIRKEDVFDNAAVEDRVYFHGNLVF